MAKTALSPLVLVGAGTGGFILLIFIVAFILPEASHPTLFSTLLSLQEYTKALPESPTRDNKSIVKPEFTTFYEEHEPGFFDKTLGNLFRTLGIMGPRLWSSRACADLMQQLIDEREKKGYKEAFLLKLKTPNKARFFVFGDVQGALHSVVRDLAKLKEMDVIDNDLKIKNDTDFIFFLGDLVDRSAYSLETLMIAMRMISKNPEHCMYIRGNHESDNYWQNYGLKSQLDAMAKGVQKSGEKFPMESMVQRFFYTLPLIVYAGIPGDLDAKFVRFSHEGGDEYEIQKINMGQYADFLKKPSSDLLTCFSVAGLSGDGNGADGVETKAIVRCEIKRKSYQSMDGMRQLAPENGVPSWTIFSAQTAIYQEGISFFNDSFGMITTGESVSDWNIALYYQDVRKLDGYKTRTCNLISGEEVTDSK